MEDALVKLLQKAHKVNALKAIVIGKAVNITSTKFDLERFEAPKLIDVRINAIIDDNQNSSFKIIPENNSYCVVGILEGVDSEAVLISTSLVNRVHAKIGNNEMFINGDVVFLKSNNAIIKANSKGVTVTKGNNDLKEILTSIIDEINKIVVVIGTSPNIAALTVLKTKLQNLFE